MAGEVEAGGRRDGSHRDPGPAPQHRQRAASAWPAAPSTARPATRSALPSTAQPADGTPLSPQVPE